MIGVPTLTFSQKITSLYRSSPVVGDFIKNGNNGTASCNSILWRSETGTTLSGVVNMEYVLGQKMSLQVNFYPAMLYLD